MTEQWLDEAGDPRKGETLDQAALEEWLQVALQNPNGTLSEVKQFPAGSSNLTYLLRFDGEELVLRRPPFGSRGGSAHDMGREYRVLDGLHPIFPLAPKPMAECDDSDVIGAPFYLMQRLHGVILHKEAPPALAEDPALCRQLCLRWIELLAQLHDLDISNTGLADLGQAEGYVARQVSGWQRRYSAALTEDVPKATALMDWLEANQPGETAHGSLIHNDYKFDNVVLDPKDFSRIIGVLDWEMTTLGDPLMDLGCSLAYWVEANDSPGFQAIRMMPTHLPGMMTRDEIVDSYCAARGLAAVNFTFYRVFGLFRLAGIAQQIYARYKAGHTQDKRFAQFGALVSLLIGEATALTETDK
jgi:aminoglycoside phosphotransferase (APT) family kinase protein